MNQNPSIRSANIFGAEIQYFRLEKRYWRPILQKFKDTGLKNVTTYVQWATHLVGPPSAAHPAGELDFEGRTNPNLNLYHFLDLVQEMGLELNFRCGPFCCNEMIHGAYPDWLIMGDPTMMVWDYQNRTTQGYWIGKREGSQPSYLHPEYLAWCRKWINEVDKIIKPRLKSNGGFITMVNLDNEVSYIVQDGMLTSDYNPVNVGRGGFYHQFLTEKYGNATALPYPQKYASIEDVQPPRQVPDEVGDDFAWYADWCEFKTWAMSKYIAALREMHEANGVKDVTFMTNFNPHRPEGVPTRMPEFEKATGPLGIAGYDFYRGTFMSYSGYQSMARVLKLMNATLRYTWSAEFMSGTWERALKSRVSDDHMRFMALCALAQGCKALSWFMFHDRDCWGDSPVSSHGHARPSLAVLKAVKKLACETIKGWDDLVPATDLAVIYDLTSHQHSYIGDPSPCNDNALYVGEPVVDGAKCGQASLEYEGIFRIVEHTGRQASVIDPVHSVAKLAAAPLVILPGSPVIHGTTAQALEKYVHDGGKLVVSGTWPGRNDAGAVITFLGGAPAKSGEPVSKGKGSIWWMPVGLGSGQPEEDSVESIAWLTALLDKETPAPKVRVEPEGTVSWVDWNTGKDMKSEGGHRVYKQPRNLFSAVLHEGPEDRILFALNHYTEAARAKVTFADKSASSLVDLESGEILPVTAGVALIDLDRKSAAVFRVVKKMNTPTLPEWNLDSLTSVPRVYADPEHSVEGVEAIFFEGVPWKGKPTRVFAYYGMPPTRPGEQVPAMVLVHGGGGSAFIPWVKLWVSRGYAAIAMDTCGCISGGGYENHPRHADGGPAGWGGFDQVDEPAEDQWTFHAVSAVLRAHSLLRSFPQVDPSRIGITGVSWGGYLACIAAGIDRRFAFAAPVYGCGFLTENSTWLGEFEKMKPGSAERWRRLWDPSVYLPQVKCPMLWVNGTNDFAFPMDSWQKSYRLPGGPRTLSLRVRMEHGHGGPGENPPEIHALAEALFRGSSPLAKITQCNLESGVLTASFESREPITKAELSYTTDTGPWVDRHWQMLPAELDAPGGLAHATLPAATTVCYMNLFDAQDRVVSGEFLEI